MDNINWDNVSDPTGRPVPGGYAAKIVKVEDVEEKQYIKIFWDFADGEFKGSNQSTYDRAGFWPITLIRSYKPAALPFFKGFKTAVENSNSGYTFRNDPQSLVGKFFGVVLGEEEYEKNDGTTGKRLYVAESRSGQSIRSGDFKVPELKRLPGRSNTGAPFPEMSPIGEDDGELPF